jgi:hypothetical protein
MARHDSVWAFVFELELKRTKIVAGFSQAIVKERRKNCKT